MESECVKIASDGLMNMGWFYDKRWFVEFINHDNYNKALINISILENCKKITSKESDIFKEVALMGYNRYLEFQDYLKNNSRKVAQDFIGKRKIRNFILKRDNYKCLCCGVNHNLTIDHIIPIHKGGKNELSNLQTLCKSCNSKKGIKIIDYR